MKRFSISVPDDSIRQALVDKINNLTKPKGSLGMLEELALQIGLVQQTLSPRLANPCNILFAADHGIIAEGVSVSPKEVTRQQVEHFVTGHGAGINFLCNQNGFRLVVVDAGVDYDFPSGSGVVDMKVRHGSGNFLHEPAMTHTEAAECLRRGALMVDKVAAEGCNIISFGEMGSGNTSAASMWMHLLTGIPLPQCIGAGAGLDRQGVSHKLDTLTRALGNYNGADNMLSRLEWFGGLEMMMATGAMLRAAELGMIILVDGFIMTACMAAALHFHPAIAHYAIYGHCGDESGHRLMLDSLGARPLLSLGLRLGEGSGAVCAYPIVLSAVNMLNEMDSFRKVDVTKYF